MFAVFLYPVGVLLGLTTFASAASWSYNVSSCPGYTLESLQTTQHGLTAQLNLSGDACNAFSTDIANLTVEVTYETQSRLHVNIYDTASQQFTLPEAYFEPRSSPSTSTSPTFVNSSDLVFNYDSTPFAFWITRRSDPNSPIFDTRISSLPATPIAAFVNSTVNGSSTGFDGFPLVFEDQYLQLTSALPVDTNIYGLGEVVSSSGFRRDVSVNGTLQTIWARDDADPVNLNIYGSHTVYLEHRFNETTNTSQSHGVFLSSAAGSDILLATPPSSNTSLIQYRMLGGTLDLHFLSGPDPKTVIEQYSEVVGKPTWQPMWGFGFHLCRWGYTNLSVLQDQVESMRAANIPLETIWNDIDLYHSLRDFTSDPISYPGDQMREFIQNLTANGQHCTFSPELQTRSAEPRSRSSRVIFCNGLAIPTVLSTQPSCDSPSVWLALGIITGLPILLWTYKVDGLPSLSSASELPLIRAECSV